MFTKSLDFLSDSAKDKYKKTLNIYPVLDGIIINEFGLSKNKIKIIDVINELYNTDVIVEKNKKLIVVTIDLINKKIIIDNPTLPYKTVYDNYLKKYIAPEYYLYQNKKRTVLRKHMVKLNPVYANKYAFQIKENSNEYGVVIDVNIEGFDINYLIKKLLEYDIDINNLHDLLMVISKIIDLHLIRITITDKNGSRITVDMGTLKEYVEYRDTEKEKQKIFLHNNEFIIEKKTIEKYDDDITPFMKRLGVYNGKEKRKN